jgi:excisionase family DNA binding protein
MRAESRARLPKALPRAHVVEIPERLRCCERTIRRAIDRGALLAGRLRGATAARGSYRIRRADLDAWLFSRRRGGA